MNGQSFFASLLLMSAIFHTARFIIGAVVFWTNKVAEKTVIKEKHSPEYYKMEFVVACILWGIFNFLN